MALTHLDGGVQRAAAPSGPVVLRQNVYADVSGQRAVGEGENVSGVNPVRARCLSDEVLTYTSILYDKKTRMSP